MPGEQIAEEVYFAVQALIFTRDCDLSTYRFLYPREGGEWHVAVVGEPPPEDVHLQIEAMVSHGKLVTLPFDVLSFLAKRRAEQTLIGPWVERHYRPVPHNRRKDRGKKPRPE